MTAGKPAHILVVDDETLAADAMADYLARKGYRVSTAQDGDGALRVYAADPMDLVVTDIRMPKSDGNELIAVLRRRNQELPIIVVSGQMDMEPNVEGLGLNRDAVLKKPVDLRELGALVETVLDGAAQ